MTPGRCRDEGDRPGCLGVADERYTMRFDEIGEAPLHWCAACGPEAQAMNDALDVAFAIGGEAFKEDLAAALDRQEQAARN